MNTKRTPGTLRCCTSGSRDAPVRSEMLALAMSVAVLCSGLNGLLQVLKLTWEMGHGVVR